VIILQHIIKLQLLVGLDIEASFMMQCNMSLVTSSRKHFEHSNN